jgi:hypothetical protein
MFWAAFTSRSWISPQAEACRGGAGTAKRRAADALVEVEATAAGGAAHNCAPTDTICGRGSITFRHPPCLLSPRDIESIRERCITQRAEQVD